MAAKRKTKTSKRRVSKKTSMKQRISITLKGSTGTSAAPSVISMIQPSNPTQPVFLNAHTPMKPPPAPTAPAPIRSAHADPTFRPMPPPDLSGIHSDIGLLKDHISNIKKTHAQHDKRIQETHDLSVGAMDTAKRVRFDNANTAKELGRGIDKLHAGLTDHSSQLSAIQQQTRGLHEASLDQANRLRQQEDTSLAHSAQLDALRNDAGVLRDMTGDAFGRHAQLLRGLHDDTTALMGETGVIGRHFLDEQDRQRNMNNALIDQVSRTQNALSHTAAQTNLMHQAIQRRVDDIEDVTDSHGKKIGSLQRGVAHARRGIAELADDVDAMGDVGETVGNRALTMAGAALRGAARARGNLNDLALDMADTQDQLGALAPLPPMGTQTDGGLADIMNSDGGDGGDLLTPLKRRRVTDEGNALITPQPSLSLPALPDSPTDSSDSADT